jgi:hypothetical protein
LKYLLQMFNTSGVFTISRKRTPGGVQYL